MDNTLLLVDKDTRFLSTLQSHLSDTGFRVLCAAGEEEANRVLEQTRPDLLLTEIMLERMDGGFCLAWRAKRKYPGLPVMIVSAVTWENGLYFDLSGPEERAWIKADAFLDKPIRPEEVDREIRRLLPLCANTAH